MQKKFSKKVFCYILFILFLNAAKAHCQTKSSLTEKLAANKELYNVNIDKAFKETDNLLKEASKANDVSAKMQLYERRCKYFYSKLNVNQLVTQAEQLYKIAKGNNDVYYQSMANIYLAEVFSINGLHDKAMVYLNENLAITKN